ncbi:MAG: NAD(P) transhydrogenase subunit alpha [Chitinophagales bacterium]
MLTIYLVVFTIFLGWELISKVPTVLHTPLMSGANAISGVVIIGAIILIRTADPSDYFTLVIATIGVILGTINVMGGFSVTNRMLEMFSKKKKK